MSSVSKKPDWSPALKVKCLVFFPHLTSQANSVSVDLSVCSRLPFRLCHSVHTLAAFQSSAHVWVGFFFLILFFLGGGGIAGISFTLSACWCLRTDRTAREFCTHARSQAGRCTWAYTHTHTADSQIHYCLLTLPPCVSVSGWATFSRISSTASVALRLLTPPPPPSLAPVVRVELQRSHAFHYR